MENVPGQNGVLTFKVFVLSLSLHVQGCVQFCVFVYYHMFGKLATLLFCPRMYVGGECSCFPKIPVLCTQERGSWKTVSYFQVCAMRITKALEYTVYTLASFLYGFIVTYVI